MIYYARCSHCRYQETGESNSIGNFQCPKCQSTTFDLYVGRVPPWWIDEAETPEPVAASILIDRTFRVRFSPIDPFIVGLAIYLGFVEDPWWLLLVPLTVGSWFFNPRWSKATGWRFLHDR